MGALGVWPSRLSAGSGTGSYSGGGQWPYWGGLRGGADPSSGEAPDGDGAATAGRPDRGLGLAAAASVTPSPPRWATWARVGGLPSPLPTPDTALLPQPPTACARAETPQVSEGRGPREAGAGLGPRGGA